MFVSTHLFVLRPLPLFSLGRQGSETWPPSLQPIMTTSLCSSIPQAAYSRTRIPEEQLYSIGESFGEAMERLLLGISYGCPITRDA
jgi:hypothetical protein